jgi:hypothetical protein
VGSSDDITILERVLETQGRSLRWLALQAGIEPSYAWRMVHGERPLTAEFKAAAERIAGVPADILFPADAPEAVS